MDDRQAKIKAAEATLSKYPPSHDLRGLASSLLLIHDIDRTTAIRLIGNHTGKSDSKIESAIAAIEAKEGRRFAITESESGGLILEDLTGVRVTPTRWLIPGRIPFGKMTMIAGDGGEGKSTLTRHIAACVSCGEPAMGMVYDTGGPASVVLLSEEDGVEDVVVPHLLAEGGDLSRIHRLYAEKRDAAGKSHKVHVGPGDILEIHKTLLQHPEIRLVIIDPVVSWASAADINGNKQEDVRKILNPLVRLADETGVAMILCAHLAKQIYDKAMHSVMGSAAYVNAARLAYILTADPDNADSRLLMPVKKNLLGVEKEAATFSLRPLTDVEKELLRDKPSMITQSRGEYDALSGNLRCVSFGKNADVKADDVLAARKNKSSKSRVTQCAQWIINHVGEYAWPDAEVLEAAKAAGFTFDNYKEAKTYLKKESTRQGVEFTCKPAGKGQPWWMWFGGKRPKDRPLSPQTKNTPLTPDTPETKEPPSVGRVGSLEKCRESRECEVKEYQGLGQDSTLIGVPDHHPPKRKRKRKEAP